ncbi:FAD dependent oxidoreductase [Halenospora varia]|nr:FAD dependent oxidoreductase [Halenospora varia]
MASDTSQPRNIVIVGGGIIGCTTAYFLTRHPTFNPAIHKITILEAQSIASGASGKAGGLLALWAYPANIVPLSYGLHAELAKEHDGPKRWGYRAVHCGSITAKGKLYDTAKKEEVGGGGDEYKKLPKTRRGGKMSAPVEIPEDLSWFDRETIQAYSVMGTPETTAQVHPFLFTTSMAELAKEKGAEIIFGSVTAMDYTGPHGIKSVTYEDKETKHIHTMPATDVVVAAGPWTNHVFPEAPIEAIRAHSIVVKADVSAHAVFTDIDLPKDFGIKDASGAKKKKGGKRVNPEMYARPDGTVYACGEGDYVVPLPKSSNLVECDISRCDDIHAYISTISPTIRDGEILVKQACYLPLVEGGGGPIIGKTGIRGLFLASGHTCWGIQNGPATGKLMSEFIFDGAAKSAHIDSLDPQIAMEDS